MQSLNFGSSWVWSSTTTDKLQPLSDLLKGKSLTSKAVIKWNDQALKVFEEIKLILNSVIILAYSANGTELALVTDTRNSAIGSVLQQKLKN